MRALVKGAFNSIGFLTILPAGTDSSLDDRSHMIATFPLAGLVIGVVLAFAVMAFNYLQSPLVSAVSLVIIMIVITGGLHLDGLADTADGLASGFDKDKTLAVMTDHANGTFAVLALVAAVLLKVAIISSFTSGARSDELIQALLITPVIARWSLVLVLYFSKYPNKDGLAGSFFTSTTSFSLLIATAASLIFSLAIFPYKLVLIIFICVLTSTLLLGRYFEYRISGNTGDTLGAILEINEIILLFIFWVFLVKM